MKYRRLGRHGPVVSAIGLACDRFGGSGMDVAAAQSIVGTAIDAGVTLFDTADVAGDRGGAETVLGAALGKRRDQIMLCTKFGGDMGVEQGPRGARRYIRYAVEASLRRLGTDYIDLYQQHGPDDSMPLEETLTVLHRLVLEGKIRYYGAVNYEPWRLGESAMIRDTVNMRPLVSTQHRYNLLDRTAELDVFPACHRAGIGILATDPTANGMLSPDRDSLSAPAMPRLAQRTGALARFAQAREVSLLDVAIGGIVAQPSVAAVLIEASSVGGVRAAVSAAEWQPPPADLDALDAAAPRATSVLAGGRQRPSHQPEGMERPATPEEMTTYRPEPAGLPAANTR